QIPPDEDIGSVTGDGAFDTHKCHDVIADRGAEAFGHVLGPMAAMPSLPPRKNAKPWKPTTAGARARNEILRAVTYLGPAIWRRWSGSPPRPATHRPASRTSGNSECHAAADDQGQPLIAGDASCDVLIGRQHVLCRVIFHDMRTLTRRHRVKPRI